jgi:hypothetical protein
VPCANLVLVLRVLFRLSALSKRVDVSSISRRIFIRSKKFTALEPQGRPTRGSLWGDIFTQCVLIRSTASLHRITVQCHAEEDKKSYLSLTRSTRPRIAFSGSSLHDGCEFSAPMPAGSLISIPRRISAERRVASRLHGSPLRDQRARG